MIIVFSSGNVIDEIKSDRIGGGREGGSPLSRNLKGLVLSEQSS
jgi:hypothetical protein